MARDRQEPDTKAGCARPLGISGIVVPIALVN
jgi:hypothetical protein